MANPTQDDIKWMADFYGSIDEFTKPQFLCSGQWFACKETRDWPTMKDAQENPSDFRTISIESDTLFALFIDNKLAWSSNDYEEVQQELKHHPNGVIRVYTLNNT